MNRVLIRLVTTVAGSCSLIAGSLALPAAAATSTPVPPANVITIPSPDQLTDSVDVYRCPLLMAYAAALTKSMSKTTALSYATMLTKPLCGTVGN
jgi:hypothetical protein